MITCRCPAGDQHLHCILPIVWLSINAILRPRVGGTCASAAAAFAGGTVDVGCNCLVAKVHLDSVALPRALSSLVFMSYLFEGKRRGDHEEDVLVRFDGFSQ
jgi:hypothetical protein